MTSLDSPPLTPSSSLSASPSSSTTDLRKLASADASAYSPASSAPSSGCASPARARSRSPKALFDDADLLAPPPSAWHELYSRSPSPLGIIPIHRDFAKLIHKHEVPRKLLHVSIGFVVLYLYKAGYAPSSLVPPLTGLLVPIASADVARFSSARLNALYCRLLGFLMRESEYRGWNGVISYLVGTITVLHLFPKDVAVLSILLLSWCDTAASTVGRAWGRYTPQVRRGKSLAGCAAAWAVGAATAVGWWGWACTDPVAWHGRFAGLDGGWAVAAVGVVTGCVAAVSEAVDVFGADDNVVIPVLSAIGMWGVLKVFG